MDSGRHGASGRPVTSPVQEERRHVTEPVTILLPNMAARFAAEQKRSFTPARW